MSPTTNILWYLNGSFNKWITSILFKQDNLYSELSAYESDLADYSPFYVFFETENLPDSFSNAEIEEIQTRAKKVIDEDVRKMNVTKKK